MAAMGNMGVPIPGAPMGEEPVAVDMGGMGVPPAAMDPNEMMLQALTAVLSKWDSTDAQIAGEKNSLMETLMLIASANPPGAAEAAVMGGDPMGYGMEPA
jgi:hypothetical protein